MEFHALFQDMGKNLFKQIRILKTAGIVFSKSRKVRNRIQHVQTEKPAISYIHFNFFYCLAHTFNPIEILDKRDFDQHHRIHAGSTVICTILVFYKIVNKVPVDCPVNLSEHVILWYHVIHAEHHHLFSFFIGISCHHKRNLPIK